MNSSLPAALLQAGISKSAGKGTKRKGKAAAAAGSALAKGKVRAPAKSSPM